MIAPDLDIRVTLYLGRDGRLRCGVSVQASKDESFFAYDFETATIAITCLHSLTETGLLRRNGLPNCHDDFNQNS